MFNLTFDEVNMSIVDFSRIVREAESCDRRRSSLRSFKAKFVVVE